jgi:putative (di)nucleoside polyphosphate hydrolase
MVVADDPDQPGCRRTVTMKRNCVESDSSPIETNGEVQKFRANVGIMIVNYEHQILAGDAFHYPGEWMMPQGGIDSGETIQQALRRELIEETGLAFEKVRFMREHDAWLRYLFRKPQYKDGVFYVGQRQKWFLLEYNGLLPDADSVQEREFSRFDWVDPDWLVEQIPAFKKDVYRTVVSAFRPHFP